jgi:hypothetical protein
MVRSSIKRLYPRIHLSSKDCTTSIVFCHPRPTYFDLCVAFILRIHASVYSCACYVSIVRVDFPQITSFKDVHDHDELESVMLFHQCRGVGDRAQIRRAMLRGMADSHAMRLEFLHRLFCSVELLASQLPPHVAEPPLNRLAADLIDRGLVASLLESLQVCEGVRLCELQGNIV